MNTTYTSRLNPQFQSAGVQDVSVNLKPIKDSMDVLIKQNENELKALRSIAQDQAQIDFNRGAADLVKQYGTDYQGLDKALMGLENNLYEQIKPTYPDMAEDLLRQNDLVRLRAVEQARKDNLKKQNERIRVTSGTLLDGLEAAAVDDFLIYLGEVSTKKPEERKPQNINPFLEDLRQYNAILDRKDADGNPIFTDSQISSRKGMKGIRMDAAYRYINSLPLEDLENFYNTTFQSAQWEKDTGFNMDDIHKLSSQIKSRIRELKDDKDHAIKVRAIQDTAGLLAEYSDEKVEQLRKDSNAPKAFVEKAQKLNERMVVENWYDPENASDPTGIYEALSGMGQIANNPDTSTNGMLNKLEKGIDIMDATVVNAKKMNISDEDLKKVGAWISDSISDATFAKNVQMLDMTPWVNGLIEARRADMQKNPASYGYKGLEKFESNLPQFEKETTQAYINKMSAPADAMTAHALAYVQAKANIVDIMDYLRYTGNMEVAKNMLNKAKYDYVKTYNSNWIANSDFDKLQAEYDAGKPATYFYKGILWKYNGYQDDKAIFEAKL